MQLPGPTIRAMLWMAATGLLFTMLNATMKVLAHQLDPWLVGALRYAMGAVVMLPVVLRLGLRASWPKAPRMQFVRGAFHTGGMAIWFIALPLVSLAELTAMSFAGPIFICLGAAMFLHERMTGARWAAVLVGFAGVMLVVKPWAASGGTLTGNLLLLCSGVVFAGSFLTAKALTRYDRPEVVVLWQHLWVTFLGLPVALFWWSPPSLVQWGLLAFCGVVGSAGHYCMTRAFRIADISAVQSVKFLELIWAAILSWAIFSTLPSGWTVAGGLVIFASTFLLARHESRVAGRAA
ncbi:MAG TPA: DMT family transporter [Burkholderiales bacterium]